MRLYRFYIGWMIGEGLQGTGEQVHSLFINNHFPERELVQGQVGTVVEVLAPDAYEVEFNENDGHIYAELAVKADQLLVLLVQNPLTPPSLAKHSRGAAAIIE